MLTGPKLNLLSELISQSSKEELIWINGYLSGLIGPSAPVAATPGTVATGARKITIAYGTETGNSKKLATDFAAKAKKRGVQTKLVSLDQYRLTDLPKEEYFITVISTQGEGEPPVAAQKFYDHIHNNGFTIPQLKYGVLALGDTSYPQFCKTGEDVDSQLQRLGANRIAPLQKCDLDYEEMAHNWFSELLHSLDAVGMPAVTAAPAIAPETKKATGKKNHTGTILTNINLNAEGSAKRTYHIEIAAEGVEYLPGDSIGIVPENPVEMVEEIITLSKVDRNKELVWKNETLSIETLLLKKINIRYLLDKAVKQYAALAEQEIPAGRTDLVDLLRKYPLKDAAQFETLLQGLTAIAPRIYNIASSPALHEGEVHITVLQDAFTVNEMKQYGLCTGYLEGKNSGEEIQFFIQPNKRFRLPAADKDIIMIGPGTGIAPFRSFVAERDTTGATGRNWLFFGEEQFTTDFLYQTEWQDWFNTGTLTNINLAFNKDTEAQLHVQHKLLQKARELFEWIQNGAFVYLCGEKDPMSKEVEAALLTVIEQEGKLTREAAVKYFEQLKEEGRYMKDVY
ncbi:MAG: assimilatory sulfite reductase (NADPH) flavoprotein subunit [Sediminibacterium sp.]